MTCHESATTSQESVKDTRRDDMLDLVITLLEIEDMTLDLTNKTHLF